MPISAWDMDRDHLRRLLAHLKRALRMKQRLTIEEFYQLFGMAEAIIDYGRMIEVYGEHSPLFVIVEIPDLALRFRETPRAIKDALLLLGDMGRAEPINLQGCWKLELAGTLLNVREGGRLATRDTNAYEDDNRNDRGAA